MLFVFSFKFYELPNPILCYSIHHTCPIHLFVSFPTQYYSSFPPFLFNLSSLPFSSQDESSALAQTALSAYQYELKKMSLRAVNFLLVNPGKKVNETVSSIETTHATLCYTII